MTHVLDRNLVYMSYAMSSHVISLYKLRYVPNIHNMRWYHQDRESGYHFQRNKVKDNINNICYYYHDDVSICVLYIHHTHIILYHNDV